MIVIGVDVHKHSLTAVAVDETGRLLAERTLRSAEDGLLAWASQLDGERVWAVEDCRHVTGALERQLVAAGERLLRVPPRLTAARAAGRQGTREVGLDRRARCRQSVAARAVSRPASGRRGAPARVEAAGRAP
jgi:transposase